uniref:Uncharacterized protein n=1 Tax=viral metagenome TaxID=1070528 RepID=A0A6C0IBP6_9ZZZZ
MRITILDDTVESSTNNTDIYIINLTEMLTVNPYIFENNLIRIRQLLYPAPYIIINTKKEEYIKVISSNLNIPILDSFDEDKITHIYNIFIEEQSKEITQIYYINEELTKISYVGLGDYLNGCCFLYEFAKTHNRKLNIDFSHNELSKILYCKSYKSLDDTRSIQHMSGMNYDINVLHNTNNIFINMNIPSNIDDTMRQYIIESALLPRLQFQEDIKSLKMKLNIEDTKYTIVHIRTGDKYLLLNMENETEIQCIMIITLKKLISMNINIYDCIFISDNNILSELLSKQNLKSSNLQKAHIGKSTSFEGIHDTMLEFFLMSTAKEIMQFSFYEWGSNFSSIINNLYKVPIKKFNFNDINH